MSIRGPERRGLDQNWNSVDGSRANCNPIQVTWWNFKFVIVVSSVSSYKIIRFDAVQMSIKFSYFHYFIHYRDSHFHLKYSRWQSVKKLKKIWKSFPRLSSSLFFQWKFTKLSNKKFDLDKLWRFSLHPIICFTLNSTRFLHQIDRHRS